MSSKEKKDTTKRKELLWRADLDSEASPSKKEKRKSKKGENEEEKKKKKEGLPPNIDRIRTHVTCEIDRPVHTSSYSSSSAFSSSGFDNSFDFETFKKNFEFKIRHITDEEMVFDLVGIDAPLANALRRILLSEIPTMAFEKVYIRNNTSVIVDEVLAHRIGLLPIEVDSRVFNFQNPGDKPNDKDTIQFELNVTCPLNMKERKVYSGDLTWRPLGSQGEDFQEVPIKMVHNDILLVILGPGQEVNLSARAIKGVGHDHVKFSPVSTAFYRILPDVRLLEEIEGEKAEELVAKCPMKVFDIEDMGKGKKKKAVVTRSRNCTICRECIREPEWQPKIEIGRNKTHFIFTIESTGVFAPELIFHLAMKIFLGKLLNMKKAFRAL